MHCGDIGSGPPGVPAGRQGLGAASFLGLHFEHRHFGLNDAVVARDRPTPCASWVTGRRSRHPNTAKVQKVTFLVTDTFLYVPTAGFPGVARLSGWRHGGEPSSLNLSVCVIMRCPQTDRLQVTTFKCQLPVARPLLPAKSYFRTIWLAAHRAYAARAGSVHGLIALPQCLFRRAQDECRGRHFRPNPPACCIGPDRCRWPYLGSTHLGLVTFGGAARSAGATGGVVAMAGVLAKLFSLAVAAVVYVSVESIATMSGVPHAAVEFVGGGVALLGFSVAVQGVGDCGGVVVGV